MGGAGGETLAINNLTVGLSHSSVLELTNILWELQSVGFTEQTGLSAWALFRIIFCDE
jgi:hypothetical protein